MTDKNMIRDTAGDDTHAGTENDDVFAFDFADGYGDDTITGFTTGEDLIDLQNFDGRVSNFNDLTITADGNDVVIDLTAHGGGRIRLEDVALSDLGAGDFVFEIAGTDSSETLTGSASHDSIVGKGGHDSLIGGGGRDTLDGGAGNDTLSGGADDDWLHGRAGDDRLDGAAGNDTLEGGAGDDSLFGGAGHDTLYGNEGDDSLDGGAGNDWLSSHAGADTLIGGAGDDTLQGGADNDSLAGGEGGDVLYGGDGSDTLEGDAGDDWLDGGTGNDTLTGGAGNDTLDGGEGADTIVFAPGHGEDVVHRFVPGQDVLDLSLVGTVSSLAELTLVYRYGNTTIDLTDHGGGKITLNGIRPAQLDADDFIFYAAAVDGTSSAESLQGDFGDDVLTGKEGNDTLTGGDGSDTFVYALGHGNDTITDFTNGEDVIDLSAFTDVDAFNDLTASADGSNTVIDLSGHGGGTIVLQDFDVADLDATDFVFESDGI